MLCTCKAVDGRKTKNEKIDSQKIAALLRGGMLSVAYTYPQGMCSTRDLLRRWKYFVNPRSELLAHIQNTNSQYNCQAFGKQIACKTNRLGINETFASILNTPLRKMTSNRS